MSLHVRSHVFSSLKVMFFLGTPMSRKVFSTTLAGMLPNKMLRPRTPLAFYW